MDEAHLLGSERRGATLEYLITSLLCLPAPPRIMLLSATLGCPEALEAWLAPCDVITVSERQPPLHKEVLSLEDHEETGERLTTRLRDILAEPSASAIEFVYQIQSAEKTARELKGALGRLCGASGALAYHARLPLSVRTDVRDRFTSGQSRCLIATTALGLGINLPATNVIVRDNTFRGVGRLSPPDLLQMMGRAGRGDTTGQASVIVGSGDQWEPHELAQALRSEVIPPITSQLVPASSERRLRRSASQDGKGVVVSVASYLARYPEVGVSRTELQDFFARSLGGQSVSNAVPTALDWLLDPQHLLAYVDADERFHLTTLGLRAVRSVLPLSLAAGWGQLIRDLLAVDPTDAVLGAWQPLDHLIVLHLLYDGVPNLHRSFGRRLVDQVDSWTEATFHSPSVLFRRWIAGTLSASSAQELLGSLGVSGGADRRSSDHARQVGYMATFRSVILSERAAGARYDDLERQWDIKDLGGIEERWRDDVLWLLAGMANVLDVRCFFYHLKEECGAGPDRIRSVKRKLAEMRRQVLRLQQDIRYCSPLGPMLRSLRRLGHGRPGASVGFQTLRRLEEANVRSIPDLLTLRTDDLVHLGIRRDLARQIDAYIRAVASA